MKTPFFYSLLCLYILVFTGCERTELVVEKQSQNGSSFGSISVGEARTYLDKFQSSARTVSTVKKAYIWQNAKQSNLKDGKPIVIVPVSYNNSSRIVRLNEETISGNDKSNHLISDKVILYKDEMGNVKSELITIIPNVEYRNLKKGKIQGKDFSGYIIVSNYENEELISAWAYKDGKDIMQVGLRNGNSGARLMTCAEYIVDVYEKIEPGDPAHVGGGGEEGVVTIGDDHYIKAGTRSIMLGECGGGADNPGGYGGDGVNWNGTPAGGGGTAPSPYGNATIDDYDNYGRYIGSDPYYNLLQRVNDLDARGFGSTNEERPFLMANPALIDRINEYLDSFGNPSIGFMESQPDFEDQRLTWQERSTLGEGNWYYRVNLVLYLNNARKATSYTYQSGLPNPECGECRANAYKHAIYRILDSDIFGSDMAAQLGRDHEANQVDGPNRQMDLINNNVGVNIFIQHSNSGGFSYMQDRLMEEMNKPHSNLVYVKNNIVVPVDTP